MEPGSSSGMLMLLAAKGGKYIIGKVIALIGSPSVGCQSKASYQTLLLAAVATVLPRAHKIHPGKYHCRVFFCPVQTIGSLINATPFIVKYTWCNSAKVKHFNLYLC